MNFSPFGGHFPTSIPVHQYAGTKFPHEASNTLNGISTENGSLNEEVMVSSANRYPSHYNQHIVPVKYQRDISTQIGGGIPVSSPQPTENIHHYAVYDQTEQQESLKRVQYHENIHSQNIKSEEKEENGHNEYTTIGQLQQPAAMPPSWQSIAAPGSTVADYLSHLPASTLPISLHHFLKYSSSDTSPSSNKRDVETSMDTPLDHPQPHQHEQHNHLQHGDAHSDLLAPNKRKKKKKILKEKKPRPKPGEIRLTTALDGSTLYCCPECHMAYPDKGLLEQHLLGHTMERRFFCDICGAGLKRKDHLTRHKQSHNPDRPFVCTVCMKAFKRKEQLTLHFVIHSGEKRHICPECGKGFYRKDHLRKHTRSHIARRVKAEMSQHAPTQVPRGDQS